MHFDRLKFVFFKIGKTASKSLSVEKHTKMKNVKPFKELFSSHCKKFLILLEKVFNCLFSKKCPKLWYCPFVVFQFSDMFQKAWSFIKKKKKVFWQILDSPTIWKHRDKLLLKNIKTFRRIKFFGEDTHLLRNTDWIFHHVLIVYFFLRMT